MEDLIADYKNGMDIYSICKKYHFGKLKVKKILADNGVTLRKRGGQSKCINYAITDWKIEKYQKIDGFHYIAKDRNDGFETNDYMNNAGVLTSHIKNIYGIEIPSLYERREYYKINGNYWWEKWFDIIKVEDKKTKKCPYCNWETVDIENKSGAFETHLKNIHGKSKIEYISEFPKEREYFSLVSKTLDLQMEKDNDKFVTCEICGKKLSSIDKRHLKKHGISKAEYIDKYNSKLVSIVLHRKLRDNAIEANKYIEKTYESSYEKEIKEMIISNGFECGKNRKVLNGEELDIYIPSIRTAIEFNGIYWHQEKFGKDKNYHLSKLNKCNEKGIKLISIFEDEYYNKKELTLAKIKHILGIDYGNPKIMARKCVINEINAKEAKEFLNANHIQGFAKSTVYYGCFYLNKLYGVMTFTISDKSSNKWELSRFATLNGFLCQGFGGKLFKHFVNDKSPSIVYSFADRRWTINENDNLYTKLGFKLADKLKPDYRYYNSKIDKYTRFHKFNFRKQILHRKYGFPLEMTEREMTKELGYDRIWDCGLLKYVWENND